MQGTFGKHSVGYLDDCPKAGTKKHLEKVQVDIKFVALFLVFCFHRGSLILKNLKDLHPSKISYSGIVYESY